MSKKIFSWLLLCSLLTGNVLAQESFPPAGSDVSETSSLFQFTLSRLPLHKHISVGPVIGARSAMAVDLDSGELLYQKNPYKRLPIASITKIMTAIVLLQESNDMSDTVVIPTGIESIEPSKMYLVPGDVLTKKQLLYGMLIHSANDAAVVVSQIIPDCIRKMNDTAAELRLNDTHFSNPVGWDEDENYSSAYDLIRLMQYAVTKPLLLGALETKMMEISSLKGKTYQLKSTNELFGSFLDEVGGKTGTTDEAGPSFINIFRTPNKHRVVTVMLNSPARFTETKILSYWILRNFDWTHR